MSIPFLICPICIREKIHYPLQANKETKIIKCLNCKKEWTFKEFEKEYLKGKQK